MAVQLRLTTSRRLSHGWSNTPMTVSRAGGSRRELSRPRLRARKLLCRLTKTGSYGDLSINMVPVHQTIQDCEWDR
jgi:hypothetical protein